MVREMSEMLAWNGTGVTEVLSLVRVLGGCLKLKYVYLQSSNGGLGHVCEVDMDLRVIGDL